jgi:hypothetical protein
MTGDIGNNFDDLNGLFPDNYELRKFRVSEISYPINGESCLKYLLVANRLTENDFIERSDDTKTFIRYFEQSPEILYSRLGIFEDDTDL